MAKGYVARVGRTTVVVLGVLAVLAAILLVAVGVSLLVHHGGSGRSPVVTVTTSR